MSDLLARARLAARTIAPAPAMRRKQAPPLPKSRTAIAVTGT